MKCIIVDDDEFSRKSILKLCDKVDFLDVVSVYESAVEASNGIKQNHDIELIFLDIHMPELNGFEFLKTLKNPPQVIFTTSDPSKAIEAFEVEALDYLIKPLELKRFLRAVERIRPTKLGESHRPDVSYEREIFVNVDKRLIRINTNDICLIEAKGDYILIKMNSEKNHIVRSTIKNIESRLDPNIFIKVHRSFIVNLSKIVDIEDSSILINNQIIPISRNLKSQVMKKINTL